MDNVDSNNIEQKSTEENKISEVLHNRLDKRIYKRLQILLGNTNIMYVKFIELLLNNFHTKNTELDLSSLQRNIEFPTELDLSNSWRIEFPRIFSDFYWLK